MTLKQGQKEEQRGKTALTAAIEELRLWHLPSNPRRKGMPTLPRRPTRRIQRLTTPSSLSSLSIHTRHTFTFTTKKASQQASWKKHPSSWNNRKDKENYIIQAYSDYALELEVEGIFGLWILVCSVIRLDIILFGRIFGEGKNIHVCKYLST